LQPGGFLDQRLEATKQAAHGDAAALHGELTASVKKIREAAASPTYYLSRYLDFPPEVIPRSLVTFKNEHYQTDAVLRFCLGRRWHIEDKDGDLRTEALRAYLERPEQYDQALGDFLPADFRDEGHARAAAARFDRGAYPTAADDWPVYHRRLQRRRGQPLPGLSTGLPWLDRTFGGLRGLTFLGGGPGVGKSTLALFLAAHALRKHPDLGVLFYSLDMPKTVLYDRLLSMEAGVAYADLVAGAPGLEETLAGAERGLLSNVLPRLRIAEQLSLQGKKSLVQMIESDVNWLLGSDAVAEVLIVVDYFQLLPVPTDLAAGIDTDFYRVTSLQQVQEWSRTSQDPIGFPILAISEVRKGEYGRTEIGIGDLMGSARLGYGAGAVLLLESDGELTGGTVVPVRLKVAKGRDGAVRTQIDLLFEHTRSRFREAPQSKSPKQGGKAGKGKPAAKPGPGQIDPLAGLDG
jgi:hypothetical protein